MDDVKEFLDKVKSDVNLQDKLKKMGESYNGDSKDTYAVIRTNVLPIAKKLGFEFSEKEYIDYVCSLSETDRVEVPMNCELSEDDLDMVVGGVGDVYATGTSVEGDMIIVDQSVHENYLFVLPGASEEAVKSLMKHIKK